MSNQIRKIALKLHTTDPNDIVKVANILDQLKNYIGELTNGLFFKDRNEFLKQNKTLRLNINQLNRTLKELDQSIEANDLEQYRHNLVVIKDQISVFNNLINNSKEKLKDINDGATDKLSEKLETLSPEQKEELRQNKEEANQRLQTSETQPTQSTQSTQPYRNPQTPAAQPAEESNAGNEFFKPYITDPKKYKKDNNFYNKSFYTKFEKYCTPQTIHVSEKELFSVLKRKLVEAVPDIILKNDEEIIKALKVAIYTGNIKASWGNQFYNFGHGRGPAGPVAIELNLAEISSNKTGKIESDFIVKWNIAKSRFELTLVPSFQTVEVETAPDAPKKIEAPKVETPAATPVAAPVVAPVVAPVRTPAEAPEPEEYDPPDPHGYDRFDADDGGTSRTVTSRSKRISSLLKIAKMGSELSDEFFVKLNQMCGRLGIGPEDILVLMYLETRFNPHAGKSGNAAGLNQIMPQFLKTFKFQGSPDELRALKAEDQLPYIENYFRQVKQMVGRPIRNAGDLYMANLWPAGLNYAGVKKNDRDTVIISKKNGKAYTLNAPQMDFNKDGVITYGDFIDLTEDVKQRSDFKTVYGRFKKAVGDAEHKPNYKDESKKTESPKSSPPKSGKPEPKKHKPSPVASTDLDDEPTAQTSNPVISIVTKNLGIDEPPTGNVIKFIVKKVEEIMSSMADDTRYLIEVVGENKLNNAEFASLIKSALRSDLNIPAQIFSDDRKFELSYLATAEQAENIKSLCVGINRAFSKASGEEPARFAITANKLPSYRTLDLDKSLQYWRMFRINKLAQQTHCSHK